MTETEARAFGTEIELEMTPEMIAEMSNGLEPGESAFVQRNLSNLSAALTAKVMSKGFSDSPLVNVTRLSPNCSKPRNHAIDRLTPHHTAGVLSVESALEWFSKTSTRASCNYVVGYDGRIGLCVKEENRAWTSSSSANDNRAITFECCNSGWEKDGWPISDKCFDSLVRLCVDICQRYGKTALLWIPDKDKALAYTPKAHEMILTPHRWFANTNCPGPSLGAKYHELAERTTAILNGDEIDMSRDEVIQLIDERITAKLNGIDTKPSGWAKEELAEAVALGITDGQRPQGYATRQETAIMVKRGLKNKEGG